MYDHHARIPVAFSVPPQLQTATLVEFIVCKYECNALSVDSNEDEARACSAFFFVSRDSAEVCAERMEAEAS